LHDFFDFMDFGLHGFFDFMELPLQVSALALSFVLN